MPSQTLLQKLGFTEKEATLYTKILESPGITYAELAELAKINRTTCYSVVKQLIEKGLISEDLASNVVKLFAENPEILVDTHKRQEAEVRKKTELATRAVNELKKITPKTLKAQPKITYVEEGDILDFLYKKTPAWNKSAQKTHSVIWGFESAQFELDYQEFINWFWDHPSSNGLSVKLFTDHEHLRNTGVNPSDRAFFRYSKNVDYLTNIWIYGDYTIIQSLEEKPSYLIEIHEPLMTQNFRYFFQAMWQVTENLPDLGQAG